MEAFCCVCKHARSRPLLRPKPNAREDAVISPHKFAKESPVTLRVNFSSENLHARDPSFLNVALISVRDDKFARAHTAVRELLSKRPGAIVTGVEFVSGTGVDTLPQISFSLGHLFQFGGFTCLARNRRVREKNLERMCRPLWPLIALINPNRTLLREQRQWCRSHCISRRYSNSSHPRRSIRRN
jgi:hypothetical protein